MIAGRKYWIVIWYGILLLGLLGQWASIYWARRTRWQNLDEVLRAFGTVLVSVGMLILLYQPAESLWNTVAMVLLFDALLCFITAFVLGRRVDRARAETPAPAPPAREDLKPRDQADSRPDAPAEFGVSRDTSR